MMAPRGWFLGVVIVLCIVGVRSQDADSAEQKVKVDFYSESLCPYCSNFVVHYLSKIFRNGVIDIVDLRIIPYGNAHIYSDGEIVCQHGEDECKLNVIQTCAIKLWPNITDWFPFILCLEELVEDLPRVQVYQSWKMCADASGLSLGLIDKCAEGPLGEMLERQFAEETASLDPPHKYVPWVVVDGAPLYGDYVYIERAVCQAYKGFATPQVCERYSGLPMIKSVFHKRIVP